LYGETYEVTNVVGVVMTIPKKDASATISEPSRLNSYISAGVDSQNIVIISFDML
jgi:hypothetical protein